MDINQFLSPRQAAAEFGVSSDAIRNYIARGILGSRKLGSARLIERAELEALLARRTAAAK